MQSMCRRYLGHEGQSLLVSQRTTSRYLVNTRLVKYNMTRTAHVRSLDTSVDRAVTLGAVAAQVRRFYQGVTQDVDGGVEVLRGRIRSVVLKIVFLLTEFHKDVHLAFLS